MESVGNFIAFLAAMSMSVERIVEIVKTLIPFLCKENPDQRLEQKRRILIHLIAVAFACLIVWFAQKEIQAMFPQIFKTSEQISLAGIFIIGLLASGGSGFWNQSLRIVEEIKKAKKFQTTELMALKKKNEEAK